MMDRITQLKNLLHDSPNDSFLKHALALECIKVGDVTSAEQHFRSVLETDADYVGSYYHLAKLLERKGTADEAIEVYKAGIKAADRTGDRHARNELQNALDDLEDA